MKRKLWELLGQDERYKFSYTARGEDGQSRGPCNTARVAGNHSGKGLYYLAFLHEIKLLYIQKLHIYILSFCKALTDFKVYFSNKFLGISKL